MIRREGLGVFNQQNHEEFRILSFGKVWNCPIEERVFLIVWATMDVHIRNIGRVCIALRQDADTSPKF